ncbi:MAG: hypothetical protein CMI31_12055 [Opitutae bacterium]|nr:hypothetical protein [Opitutae bacterium]
MNENTKTYIFVGIAAASLAIALLTEPQGIEQASSEVDSGNVFFPAFEDPLAANKLQIVGFDEDKGLKENFEVTSSPEGWFIPSHENYPADADNQLEDVASMLIGVTKLGMETEDKGSHKEYGVVNPEKAKPGSSGVGKLVRLAKDSETLAELIIGNSFDAPAGVDSIRTLYYVREPGKDRVYSAGLRNVDDISTKFVDWVEKDFLDLDKWDVMQVHFDNYDFDETQRELEKAKKQIGKYTLSYVDGNWTSPNVKLSGAESLDKDVLDALKDAVDDLEIIDVERKPKYLAERLSKGNEFHDVKSLPQLQDIARSLASKGFYVGQSPMPGGQVALEVVSNKGEIHVGMKDGVEYVLRFGEVYLGQETDENATGSSRYLYALARLNRSLLEVPVLETVPAPIPPQKISSPDGNATSAAPTDANATAAYEKKRAERATQIARINASNANKQKTYDDKLSKANKRINELNARLAPWYYVISDDIYKKIHLDRKDFVKTDEAPKSGDQNGTPPSEIRASHILVAYKGGPDPKPSITRTKEEARARAETIRKQVSEEGKDFAQVARESSDGPSAPQGGDLGKFTFDKMVKPFSEAAFALKVGGISGVVESKFGFHVIKRTE